MAQTQTQKRKKKKARRQSSWTRDIDNIALRPHKNTTADYRNTLLMWYANKAVKYITGHNIYDINHSNYDEIFGKVDEYFHNKIHEFVVTDHCIFPCKRKDIIPLALIKPSDEYIFYWGFARNALARTLKRQLRKRLLESTGLAAELNDLVRYYPPLACVKRKNIKVDENVLVLMGIGILRTHAATVELNVSGVREYKEYVYVGADWDDPALLSTIKPMKVQKQVRNVVRDMVYSYGARYPFEERIYDKLKDIEGLKGGRVELFWLTAADDRVVLRDYKEVQFLKE